MNSIPSTSEMQQAYLQRDPSYDGLFFVGVRTTGIFCRPTCPARKPRPENVEYLRTVRAALAAGYRPCKRCRPLARAFGEAPGEHRDSECVFLSWLRSPLGPLVAGATAKGICLLEFTDRRMLEAEFAAVRKMFNVPLVPGSNDHLVRLKVELAGYFGGSVQRFTVPLVYPGSPFQRRVWEELLAIPYGERRTYQQIALAVGEPKAARAVGRANGLNRIAILIPCHRLVNKNGRLAGYGGGLWRKQFLLDLERSNR